MTPAKELRSDHRNGKSLELSRRCSHCHSPEILGPHLGQRTAPSPSSLHCRHLDLRAPESGLPPPPPTALRSWSRREPETAAARRAGRRPACEVHPGWRPRERPRGQGGGSGPTRPHARETPSRPGPTPSSATSPSWAQFRRSPRAEPLRAPHLLLPGSG